MRTPGKPRRLAPPPFAFDSDGFICSIQHRDGRMDV